MIEVNAPVPPALALRRITDGLRAAQALYVAAELKVADHLATGPMSRQELAAAVGADADALHRVMRALCALCVFVESAERAILPERHIAGPPLGCVWFLPRRSSVHGRPRPLAMLV